MFNQLSFLHREIVMRIKGTATNLIMRHTQYTTNPVYDKPSKRQTQYTTNPLYDKPSIRQTQYTANPVYGKPSIRQTQYTTNPVYDKPHKFSLIITYNCGMIGHEEEADAAGGED